jgi:hypothetical protein
MAQRYHSIAPKPGIVRRAVPADPWHGPFHPEVVTLDPLLQVFRDAVERILRQEPVFPGRRDRGRAIS